MLGFIGAGMQALGGIAGGILGARAANKERRELRRQERENRTWRDRAYNESGTERADFVNAVTKMQEAMRARQSAASGSSAVMGGGSASAAAERAAANGAIAGAMGNAAAGQQQHRDQVESQYRQRQGELNAARRAANAQRTQAIMSAAGAAANAGASALSMADMARARKQSTPQQSTVVPGQPTDVPIVDPNNVNPNMNLYA